MTIEKPEHFIMKGMVELLGGQTTWKRYDEWYEFNRNVRTQAPELKNLEILATVDETTYVGGSMGPDHVLIWCHEMDKHADDLLPTRVFYTALGHPDDSYSDPIFISHIVQGIEWVARRDPDSPQNPEPSPSLSPALSPSVSVEASTSQEPSESADISITPPGASSSSGHVQSPEPSVEKSTSSSPKPRESSETAVTKSSDASHLRRTVKVVCAFMAIGLSFSVILF